MARQNRILASIPVEYWPLLDAGLKLWDVARGDALSLSTPSRHALFPITAVISYVVRLADNSSVQVGLLNHDHGIGIDHCFLPGEGPAECFVFVPGVVLSASQDCLIALKNAFPDFLMTALGMSRYNEFLFAHQAACAASHPVGSRIASWLVYAAELCRRHELDVSQQQLADFLSARRETVGTVLADLERQDIISRARGTVVILSPERLAEKSCGCSRVLIDGHRRMREP